MQPVIQKIINQLSIDCDRFFDQVADENQDFLENEEQLARARRQKNRTSDMAIKGMDVDEKPKMRDDEE